MTAPLELEDTAAETTQSTNRRIGRYIGVAAIALLAGLLVGWLLWGSDDDSTSNITDDEITAGVMSADGTDLTEDHQQMVAMLDQYLEALRTGDYAAAAVFFEGPDFTGSVLLENGFEIPASETTGFFEDRFGLVEVFGLELVSADTIVFFHRDGEEIFVNAVRFGDFSLDEGHIEQHLIASA